MWAAAISRLAAIVRVLHEREPLPSMVMVDAQTVAPPDDQLDLDARVAQLVADHVDPARSNAYDQLGDGRRALSIAVRWLRPKLIADDPQITRS